MSEPILHWQLVTLAQNEHAMADHSVLVLGSDSLLFNCKPVSVKDLGMAVENNRTP